jgi:hypothetical protein
MFNSTGRKQFGLHFQRAGNGIGDMGEISFGLPNAERYIGELVFAPCSINTITWDTTMVRLCLN